MTTKADRDRELINHAEATTLLMERRPRKIYFGYSWAFASPPILTRQFVGKALKSYKRREKQSATEMLIRREDIKQWMDELDIQITPGIVPPLVFYLGAFHENTTDANQSQGSG